MNIPIEELLVKSGCLTEGQLKRAESFAVRRPGKNMEEVLIELGYIQEETVLSCLAESGGMETVDLACCGLSRDWAGQVPGKLAMELGVIPMGLEGERLVTAVSAPLRQESLDELEEVCGRKVKQVLALKRQIEEWLPVFYGGQELKEAAVQMDRLAARHYEKEEEERTGEEGDTPVIRMVRAMIEQAWDRGASDIHVEPGPEVLVIRFRINGELRPYVSMTMKAHRAVTTRLKVMGGMDIAVKTMPQDGRCRYSRGRIRADLRISTLPGVYGEKVVLRLMDTGRDDHLLDVKRMGMIPEQIRLFDHMLRAPYGLILVTGPTGSGKTTTLYGALKRLASGNINIMTAEDPVEKLMEGVTQLQIRPRSGLTFGAALRAILRQDPDVIMVGEMRDEETAAIGLRAAITGHLVLSTLHTGDCAAAVTRLLDMKAEPYFVASALTGVIAQRLVKVLCPFCRQVCQPGTEQVQRYRSLAQEGTDSPLPVFWKPAGCVRCGGTGWKGRRAVYEMMEVDESIREMILSGAPVRKIRSYHKSRTSADLRSLGLAMVKAGETTLEELERLVYDVE